MNTVCASQSNSQPIGSGASSERRIVSATTIRCLDVLGASAGLLFLLPGLAAIGLLIVITSPGPAVYSQVRVGRGGRLFRVFKFRSMKRNADQVGSFRTSTGDPRITTLGRVLRRTSLDELPQLWNVVRGDMSLVGPRPYVPSQESEYEPSVWSRRHSVRPGITGPAQVGGRSELSPSESIVLDLEWTAEPSLKHYLCILWRTVLVVLRQTGVN